MAYLPGEKFQEVLDGMATTCESVIYNICNNNKEQAVRRVHKLQNDFEKQLKSYREEHIQTVVRLRKTICSINSEKTTLRKQAEQLRQKCYNSEQLLKKHQSPTFIEDDDDDITDAQLLAVASNINENKGADIDADMPSQLAVLPKEMSSNKNEESEIQDDIVIVSSNVPQLVENSKTQLSSDLNVTNQKEESGFHDDSISFSPLDISTPRHQILDKLSFTSKSSTKCSTNLNTDLQLTPPTVIIPAKQPDAVVEMSSSKKIKTSPNSPDTQCPTKKIKKQKIIPNTK